MSTISAVVTFYKISFHSNCNCGNYWTCDLGRVKEIDVPIFVILERKTLGRDHLKLSEQKLDTLHRHTISSYYCNIGTETFTVAKNI